MNIMMKIPRLIIGLFLVSFVQVTLYAQTKEPEMATYKVKRVRGAVKIDADWNKRQWRSVEALTVNNFIRENPAFKPDVQAKMVYDDLNLYVIFRVADRYVRSITTDINGPVWKDSAVEFFFSPDVNKPASYFNLEVNCGGTPLLGYNSVPRLRPSVEDIREIEIAHSMPQTVDPEITDPVTWTVEYRIPLRMLKKYAMITDPGKGVVWRANFYKIAENNSNPHHASWSIINHLKPTFHLPQFFGAIEFQ